MRRRPASSGDRPRPPIRPVAFRLLSRRDYTVEELRRALEDREYPAGEIDPLISTFVADRLLDDRRVAAAHLRTAARIKGRGRLRIARELDARGVNRALVRELLAEVPADDEAAAIQRFLARKRLPAQLGVSDRRRVVQQLLRRGFPADAITKALRSRGGEEEDE